MQVSFSEVVTLSSYDVVIIVSSDTGKDFIDSKLKLLTGLDAPKCILESCVNLKYKDIKSFKLIVGGRIVELIIAGTGKKSEIKKVDIEKLGGYIFDSINSKNSKVCLFNNIESGLSDAASYISSGLYLKSLTFDKYQTEKTEKKIISISCQTCYIELNEHSYKDLQNVNEGVALVRDLVSEPANVMTPDQMLIEAQNLKKLGVKISYLDKNDMEKLGMNAILGVSQGSDQPAYVVVMEYRRDKNKDTIALVGKGLTFDSGGLCLKPSKRMGEMKGDMTGAAVVIGAMKVMALKEEPVNVVGLIGVVENMISGSAQRPGDIVKAMSGMTIEVDNTDAEGRLVLADVLWYAAEKFKPNIIIDFATLTGAIQVALGHEFAGLFSNSDELADRLLNSGNSVGEKLWRLPLHPSYEDDVKSDIADIRNVGSERGAGSITAAMFLKRFIPKTIQWAHVDIAATEWDSKSRALSKKGATGFGVRLINAFISKYCSSNT
ncbi:MAG: leucyl aminopeptidase [Holosporales bacterium]|jgi:leucyl aminopeptidase|nr:leucyl aminopeptidase [Holosporales bacterium]